MVLLFFFSLLIGIGSICCGCPNNVTCLEQETCCETSNGLWSCCPIENGICCNDGLHCCSKNEKCSSNGNCISSTNQISFAFPLRFNETELKIVSCPDGSVCTNNATCCELSSGRYACCPYYDAVCCSDHIHCCPKDHTCDLEHGHCRKNFDQLKGVVCPDGETECPDDNTCCQLDDGSYGCCQIYDAVCCSDHLHCCPRESTCDVEHGICVNHISIPWSIKTPAFHRKQKLTKIINQGLSQLNSSSKIQTERLCPDALSLCNSSFTCCLTPNATWGCCPLTDAVCCSDHKHCCPTHYKCDLHIFKCDHDTFGSIPLFEKQIPEKKISSKINVNYKSSSSLSTIVCPDEKYCPDETTCCQLKNGTYGCCPYENGNCCSDQIHCCGNGYACDESGSRCIRHFNSEKKILSSNLLKKLIKYIPKEDQLCSDGITKCLTNSTCCPNQNSNPLTYSCCPYSNGVCCGSNGSVCCPNNYDCNEDQLSCELRDSFIKRQILLSNEYYQCGSSNVYCSSDQTCCNTYGTSNEQFACCSYNNGQCCSDGEHCCPEGYICDLQGGGCLQN